jgi:molybdate transport system permease protein
VAGEVNLNLQPLWISLRLAGMTTLLLLLVGTPIAWWLSETRSRAKIILEAVVALPLVLPPTVLGFYLLLMLGANGPLSWLWDGLGVGTLAFSFSGLVIGSMIYSMPFVIQPLQNAFEAVDRRMLEAAATLGASPMDRFHSIVVPQARRAFVSAAILGFAHTIGEFGVVLMIGGNIPGRTQVLSIAIFEHVEMLQYREAHLLAAGLLAFSFIVLLAVFFLNRRFSGVIK